MTRETPCGDAGYCAPRAADTASGSASNGEEKSNTKFKYFISQDDCIWSAVVSFEDDTYHGKCADDEDSGGDEEEDSDDNDGIFS